MGIDYEGKRPRLFHERAAAEANAGYPLRDDVTLPARKRILREVESLARTPKGQTFVHAVCEEINRVLDKHFMPGFLPVGAEGISRDEFLSIVEICVNQIWFMTRSMYGVERLQSILADDLSTFRLRKVGSDPLAQFQIHKIDNEHLHREIVDKAFVLTGDKRLGAAQRDYAEAWKHYSTGDLDDAIVNAHKAFESACKSVIKAVDPTKMPEDLTTAKLVKLLVELDIVPSRLEDNAVRVAGILGNSGALRNSAGIAHGSLDLDTPESDLALLCLRLSGSYIAFLASRLSQMAAPGA